MSKIRTVQMYKWKKDTSFRKSIFYKSENVTDNAY